jgi:PAS domain S-box-containing protein
MMKPLRVLMVEDSEDDALLVIRELKKGGYEPEYERLETAEAMRDALREKSWDVILCDYRLPQFSGPEAMALLKDCGIDIPLIIVSCAIGEETAADCMRCGAGDYVMKGNLSRLVPAVERELKETESRVRHKQAEESLSEGKRELKAIYDNAPVMMCVLDEGRHVLYANNAFMEFTGIPETEIQKGRACGVFGCINALEDPRGCGFGENCKNCAIRDAMEDTFRTGQSHQGIDYRAVFDIGGVRRAVSLLGATALIKDLCPPKLLLCLQDITERRRVEHELSESEQRYSVLFNAIDEGFCIIEMIVDENEKPIDYRFLEINPVFEKQTGLINVLGKRMRELAPKLEEHWFEIFGKVALTGQSIRFMRRAEQLNRWYDVYAFPVGQPENRQVAVLFNDISERKQMVDALRESEAKLAKGEQVAQLGYWDLDIKNQKLVWSKEVYRLFGKDPDTFVPTVDAFLATIHPEDLGRVRRIRDEAMAGASNFTVDYRIILSDGSFRFMQEIVELDRDGSGVLTRIFGTVQDITERKQAEEALRESEEKWRRLVSNSPDFIALHDREGRYLFLNHYSEGFMEKDVLGKNADEFILQESRDIYRTAFEKCIRTITKQIAEYSAMGDHKKGRIYESAFIPIVRHGNEINVLVVAKDITERKQAEEALRRSEVNFRASLDDSPLGIRIVTGKGETLYANRALLDMYGYESVEELRTIPIRNRYTPQSYAEFRVRREKRRDRDDLPSEYTVGIVRKDGKIRDLQVLRKEISWDGEKQFQVIYQDITERKQAEGKLRESEERSRLLAAYHRRLNDISIGFVEASGTEDLFNRIAESFRFLTDAVAATFSVYDPETRSLKAASLSIDPISGDKVAAVFGPGLFEMCMPVGADDLRQMLSQGIKRPKDLYELSFGVIPPDTSAAIMDAVGFRQIIALAIVYAEELFGACVAYLPEGRPVVADDALKVYAYLSGLAVKRRQVEEALQASEGRYRSLFENSMMGVSQADPDGRLIVANTAYSKMYGYASPGEMMAKLTHVGQLYADPGQREEVLGILKEKGVMEPREFAVVRRDGTRFTVLVGARAIRDSKGNIKYCQAEHIDITERKRAEEALLESEIRYRQLVEYAPAGIYEADLTTGRFLSVNEVLCEYSGYTRDELLAMNPLDLMTEESRKLVLQRMAGYAAGEPVPPNVEYKARSKSGREFWISNNAKYFYHAGLPVRATVVAYDITERKRVEEELRDSTSQLRALAIRLQQIREEERVLVAREIHDEMGGGLTGLKMDLSWLLHRIGGADSVEARAALMEKIHAANALIDQLIRVVRRISTDLRPSILDDLGLVAAIEWQLSEFTSRTSIQHEFSTAFDYVDLDKDAAVAAFRIFQEALTNVVRHSQATKVGVVLREGERGPCGDETIVLEIRDNGRGITEEEILHPEALGLLGMKERVLTFGGELSIQGKPGGGTALVVKIPRKQGEEAT